MITPELLTTKMLQALQQGARVETHGGRQLFADCQTVLDFYAKNNSQTEDKTNVRVCQERLCDHLNAKHAETNARDCFGLTTAALDEVLESMTSRDMTMYAVGTLSNAQELIHKRSDGWHVRDEDANTLRQLLFIAKYAMNKAVPR